MEWWIKNVKLHSFADFRDLLQIAIAKYAMKTWFRGILVNYKVVAHSISYPTKKNVSKSEHY